MTSAAFTESIVESAALSWREGFGYAVAHGPDLASPGAKRAEFGQGGHKRRPDAERIVGRAV